MNKEELIKLKESLLAKKSELYILCNDEQYGNFDDSKTIEEIYCKINTEEAIKCIEEILEQATIYIAKKAIDVDKIELGIDYGLFISKNSLIKAKEEGINSPKNISNITKNEIVNDIIEIYPRMLYITYIGLDGEKKLFEAETTDIIKTPIRAFTIKPSELKQYIEKLGYEINMECPGFKFMKNIVPNYEDASNQTVFDIVCDFKKEKKKTK